MLRLLISLFLSCVGIQAFRAMTYNVWNFDNGRDWEMRKFKIASIINASNPDVIAVQVVVS